MSTLQEQFVVDAKGKKTGVILSRSEEPISLDEMKRRLKRDGLL
jgi:hypothetical protein